MCIRDRYTDYVPKYHARQCGDYSTTAAAGSSVALRYPILYPFVQAAWTYWTNMDNKPEMQQGHPFSWMPLYCSVRYEVEARGFEPRSETRFTTASTCVSCLLYTSPSPRDS